MRFRELRKLVEQILASGGGGGLSLGSVKMRPNPNATLVAGDATAPIAPITPVSPDVANLIVAKMSLQADADAAQANFNFRLDVPVDPADPGGPLIPVDDASGIRSPADGVSVVTLTGIVPADTDYWLFGSIGEGTNASLMLVSLYETPLG